MELETVIDLIPESVTSEMLPETAFEESHDILRESGSSQDLNSGEETSASQDLSSVEESGSSEKVLSSEEFSTAESDQSESSESKDQESSVSEETQKGSSDTDMVTEIPSDSGVSSSDSLDDKRTDSFSPAVGSDSGLDFSSDSNSGFDFEPGASDSSDILDQMDVFAFSEMDPEVISDWQGNLAACRGSLASCVSLLLFGDILLCLLLGCLCTSIFSRFWKVNR